MRTNKFEPWIYFFNELFSKDSKDGSFSKNVPQFFSGSDEMGKNVTNFQKSPFTRMNFPPPPIHSSASPSVQNTKPPHVQGQMHSQGHLQAQAAIGNQKESFDSQLNVSSEPFVPGHRKRPSTPGTFLKFTVLVFFCIRLSINVSSRTRNRKFLKIGP